MVSDRKGIAFYLPENRILLDELPDDFFDISQTEAKMLYQEFVQKRKELDDRPMMTTSMRELEKTKRVSQFLERYKYCIVRIQFSDRSVLQGIFQPTELFSQVNDFVKSHLREDLDDFFLFTTPPKSIPGADKTLLELGFVPGVKLYFGTASTHLSTFLKEQILVNIRSPEIADREAHRFRMTKVVKEEDNKKEGEEGRDKMTEYCGCDKEKQQARAEDQVSESTTNGAVGGARPKTSPSKVPKWFKPSKK